jgi:hypothetical protein
MCENFPMDKYPSGLRRLASLAVVATSLSLASQAAARPRPVRAESFSANKSFGLGLMLGAPTGLSGKYYLGADTALDFGVGFIGRYRYSNALHLHADFLWHPVVLASTPPFLLPLYFGVGGRLLQHDENRDRDYDYDNGTHVGVRAPIGIAMDFNRVPLDVFFELALVLDLIVDDGHGYFELDGSVGVRYYFN